jgi:hypothetical protein
MRRLLLGALIGVCTSGLASTFAPLEASGQAVYAGSFRATARADTVGIELFDAAAPVFPDGQVLFLTPSSAQAAVDSLRSSAFAGAPFAGETATGLPGTVNGLASGKLPPLPATLPGYISSSFPIDSNPDPVEVGPYSISASSEADRSDATARIGLSTTEPAILSSTATATAGMVEGVPTAIASATIHPLSIVGVIELGEVNAEATATLGPDGTAMLESSFDLGLTTIAGLRIGLTQDGLVLADTVIPLPGAASLAALLQPLGIHFQYLPEERTDTSITSAGLVVSYEADVPAQGTVRVSYVLGRVTASAAPRTGLTLPEPSRIPSPAVSPVTTPPSPTPSSPPLIRPRVPDAVDPVTLVQRRMRVSVELPHDVLPLYPTMVMGGLLGAGLALRDGRGGRSLRWEDPDA